MSIIIPVYNAESTLEKCINSIQTSSMEDYEIILVDDGSTDASLHICNNLKSQRNNIVVLHQDNQGAGAARNYGLKKSRGEYVGFMDADDEVSYNYFQIMYEYAKQNFADIVMSSVKIINKTCIEEAYLPYPDEYSLGKSEILNNYIPLMIGSKCEKKYKNKIIKAMWCRIFSKSLIDENNISFCELKNGQDFVFSLEASVAANKITICKQVEYIYHFENFQTLSKNYSKKKFEYLKNLENKVKDILTENDLFLVCQSQFIQLCRHDVYWILRMIVTRSNYNFKNKYKECEKMLNIVNVNELFYIGNEEIGITQKILYMMIKNKFIFMLILLISIKERM